MIRKTALLTSIAGLMLTAAPALAQEAMTPPAPTTTQTAPSPAPAPTEQPATLQLQPGSDVKGSDGTVLGKLEGARNNDAGEQELTVRGPDGQLKGVPLGGLRQDGAGVVVGWTSAEYTAAPAIADDAAPTEATTPPATDEPASDSAETETAEPAPTEPQ
ncbi:superoxide dismutase [Brevundimonas sp.]|uniref:superoxide dismutase n=1 Tax=Brevundimonas sp. TaxID=1871086 RepID=UPI001A2FC289|nr:superoxide dismutase [Brevundimonas sp.]MBJ7486193.1 superoxide dismutase [Brevundimonas sp.]